MKKAWPVLSLWVLLGMWYFATGAARAQEVKEHPVCDLAAELKSGRKVGIYVGAWRPGSANWNPGEMLTLEPGGGMGAKLLRRGVKGDCVVDLGSRAATAGELAALQSWLDARRVEELPADGMKSPESVDRLVIWPAAGENGEAGERVLVGKEKPKKDDEPREAGAPEEILDGLWQRRAEEEAKRPVPDVAGAWAKYREIAVPLEKKMDLLNEPYVDKVPPAEVDREISLLDRQEQAAKRIYEEVVSRAICHGTRVELVRLGDVYQLQQDTEAGKPMPELFRQYPVLGREPVTGAVMRELLAALQCSVVLPEPNWVTMCYEPHHGLRIWGEDGRLILETDICVTCNGFAYSCGEGEAAGKSGHNGVGQSLRRVLWKIDGK